MYGKNKDMSPLEVIDLDCELEQDDYFPDAESLMRETGLSLKEAQEDVDEAQERLVALMSKYVGRELKSRDEAVRLDLDDEGLEAPSDISQRHKDLW